MVWPVNKFEWVKYTSQFNEGFIKDYNEKRDEIYFLEVDVQYYRKLLDLHIDSPFLSERMKIKKIEKLVANKSEYIINIRNLKQKVHKEIRLIKMFG